MGKIKTSKKQKSSSASLKNKASQFISLQPGVKTYRWSPSAEILDEDKVSSALFQCLKEGDIESFKEILTAHLEMKIKSKSAKSHGLSERTMYEALSEKGNPSLKTIAKIVQMAFAA